jgi:hypothetical protein
MARRKLAFVVRQQRARRRDYRRVTARLANQDVADHAPNPSRVVEGQELLLEVQKRLTAEERQVADRPGTGQAWSAIAAELGGTPDGRRMQLTRALDRVTRQLGLEEYSDG